MLSKCGLGIVHGEIVYILQSAKVLVHACAGRMKLLRGPYVGHPCTRPNAR